MLKSKQPLKAREGKDKPTTGGGWSTCWVYGGETYGPVCGRAGQKLRGRKEMTEKYLREPHSKSNAGLGGLKMGEDGHSQRIPTWRRCKGVRSGVLSKCNDRGPKTVGLSTCQVHVRLKTAEQGAWHGTRSLTGLGKETPHQRVTTMEKKTGWFIGREKGTRCRFQRC